MHALHRLVQGGYCAEERATAFAGARRHQAVAASRGTVSVEGCRGSQRYAAAPPAPLRMPTSSIAKIGLLVFVLWGSWCSGAGAESGGGRGGCATHAPSHVEPRRPHMAVAPCGHQCRVPGQGLRECGFAAHGARSLTASLTCVNPAPWGRCACRGFTQPARRPSGPRSDANVVEERVDRGKAGNSVRVRPGFLVF